MPTLTQDRTEPAKAAQAVTGVVPHLTCADAPKAIAFYTKAFGAREIGRHMAEDGKRIMHAHIVINGGNVFLHDDFPEYRGGAAAPEPASICLHLHVDNADTWWQRALDAGATVMMPLENQFWGDRYGQLKDPWGYVWSIGQTLDQP
jgi:PhnB protein